MSRKTIAEIDHYTNEFRCGICGKWNDLDKECPCRAREEEKQDGIRDNLGRVFEEGIGKGE